MHRRWIATLVATLAALTLAGCSAGPAVPSLNKNSSTFSLDKLSGDLVWSKALIVCPYETQRSVAERLGLDEAPALPDMTSRDDVQVVVFVDDSGAVTSQTAARTPLDLCASGQPWQPLAYEDRTLPVTREGDGWVVTKDNP